jgi:hypothetical protein
VPLSRTNSANMRSIFDFSAENVEIEDWVAERGGFEPPRPFRIRGAEFNSYAAYYNEVRTHLSLEKNAPAPRTVQGIGQITALPLLGGLHHQYVWI